VKPADRYSKAWNDDEEISKQGDRNTSGSTINERSYDYDEKAC
jgi:hypothetical protein